MLSFLLSGDGTVAAEVTTRAQIPLLLAQYVVTTAFAIDQAVETDTAFDFEVLLGTDVLVTISTAVETDTAFNLTVENPPGVILLAIDQAVETDTAFELTPVGSVQGTYPGVTYPSSTTYPWSGAYYTIDTAVETDEAFDFTVDQEWWTPATQVTGVAITAVTDVEPAESLLAPVTPT